MAKGKTDTGRLWDYVRDDRPFGGSDAPAVIFHYSRDRRAEHPRAHLASWPGVLHADAYAGFGEVYATDHQPGPILEAGCFAHARRKFFEFADVEGAARRKIRRLEALLPWNWWTNQRAIAARSNNAAAFGVCLRLLARRERLIFPPRIFDAFHSCFASFAR